MDNKHAILLYLAKKRDIYTLHELSQLTNIPYTTFYRTIKTMEDTVTIRTKRKSKLVETKWNEITKAYLTIASWEEKKEFLNTHKLIRKINERAQDITLIFGSYAKGTPTQHSDIDVMVINEDGERTVGFSGIEMLYDIKINPLYIPTEEFKKMLQDRHENVAKQALSNHILLSGYAAFWELVDDAVRTQRV